MCLGYLAGWGAMFDSMTFRWTYMTWTFFGVMTTVSVFLTMLSLILGIICRFNFGKGLPYYCAWSIFVACALLLMLRTIVNAQEPIEGFDTVIAGDPEKVVFPSSKEQTFPVAFGSRIQIPLPRISTQNPALRFAQPMRMPGQTSLQQPPRAITRTPSERTYHPLHRASSQISVDSSSSDISVEHTGDNKRWVLE